MPIRGIGSNSVDGKLHKVQHSLMKMMATLAIVSEHYYKDVKME